jgi:hypothetical protein
LRSNPRGQDDAGMDKTTSYFKELSRPDEATCEAGSLGGGQPEAVVPNDPERRLDGAAEIG